MHETLAKFPVVIEIPIAWGEMDAFQHVNNIVYLRYFESGRMAYFERLQLLNFMERTGIGPILASIQCKFKVPLTYPDIVSVGTHVSSVGTDRFTMEYIVVSHKHQKPAAQGEGVIVSFDYRGNKKASLPEELRRRIAQVEALASKT